MHNRSAPFVFSGAPLGDGIYFQSAYGVVPGFSPRKIAGLSLWLDGNDPLATGSKPANNTAISTWKDKSGNAYDYTQGTGANQPLFKTNIVGTNGSVLFDGASDYLERVYTAGIDTTDCTLFVCVQSAADDANFQSPYTMRSNSSGLRGYTMYKAPTPDNVYSGLLGTGVASWNSFVGPVVTSTVNQIFTHYLVNGSAAIRVNNAPVWGNDLTYVNETGIATSPTRVGAGATEGAANFFWNGYVHEIVMYNRGLSDDEITAIQDYLSAKWSVALFTPAQVSGLKLWVEANNPAGTGIQPAASSARSSWVDLSGNGNNATQGTGANQPTYETAILSAKSAISFDGTNDSINGTIAGLAANPNYSIFYVWQLGRTTGTNVAFGIGNGNGSGLSSGTGQNGAGNFFNVFDWGGENTYYSINDTNPHFVTATRENVTNTHDFYVDGLPETASATAPVALNVANNYTLGQHANPSFRFNMQGYIMELLFFDEVVSNDDRLLIEGYLQTKWGIT